MSAAGAEVIGRNGDGKRGHNGSTSKDPAPCVSTDAFSSLRHFYEIINEYETERSRHGRLVIFI